MYSWFIIYNGCQVKILILIFSGFILYIYNKEIMYNRKRVIKIMNMFVSNKKGVLSHFVIFLPRISLFKIALCILKYYAIICLYKFNNNSFFYFFRVLVFLLKTIYQFKKLNKICSLFCLRACSSLVCVVDCG